MLWQERFVASSAWQHLEQVRAHMNASVAPEDPSDSDALAYVGSVIELLERRRIDSDPLEITPTMLSSLASATASLAAYVESVNTGGHSWSMITPQADAVIDALAAWPPLEIAHYLSGLHSAVEGFQTKATQAVTVVRETARDVENELQTLREGQGDIKALVDTERQRITEAIAQFTADSSAAVAQVQEDQEQRLLDIAARWETTEAAATSRADATVQRLGELEKEARNVVHATTSHIVATDYGRYARNKTIAAWVCDIAAALIGAAGLAVIVFHLLSLDPESDANIGLSLTRLAVSLGTLGVAGLLGHRGQQHHLEARAAKRTDLALRQVLPFTANLDEDDRRAIVREFTDRVFIRGDIDTPKAPRTIPSLRRPTEAQTYTAGEPPE